MVNVTTFYAAVTAWLSLQGLTDYTISEVMELHKLAGMRHYTASIIPSRPPNSTIEEPEIFERVFRQGGPKGFVLVDVSTGQFYSKDKSPKSTWLIVLTFISTNYNEIAAKNDVNWEKNALRLINHPQFRRFLNHPMVEVGPGAFKSEMIEYPPNFLQMNLKKLIRIKEKIEASHKEHEILNPRRFKNIARERHW